MAWFGRFGFWSGLLLGAVALIVAFVALNRSRFSRRLASEVQALFDASSGTSRLALERAPDLPPPVRRYLERALGSAPHAVSALRVRHGGRFRARLDAGWRPIRGEQYYTVEPPAFLWWGRLALAPGLWIDAVDRGVEGRGRMQVSVESSITLFDRSGPELDQGAMLRLLSELVLLPGLFLDARYTTWQAVDEGRARCTFRAPGTGLSVAGTFEFGADGLATSFHAERYLDTGEGAPRLLPWSGEYLDYRSAGGTLVPHHFIGYWHVDGRRVAYVDFTLEPPELDVSQPFDRARRY